jgi:mitogen-activated protein kinase kinase
MATQLRKKRNFRGLQLQVNEPSSAPNPPAPPPIPPFNLAEIQPLVIRKSTSQTPTATNSGLQSTLLTAGNSSHTKVTSPVGIASPLSAQPRSGAAPALGKPPGGKKRPPPMTLKAPKLPPSNINVVSSSSSSTVVNEEGSAITVVNTAGTANSAPNTASFVSGRRNTYHAHLSNALANLDMNAEIKFELKAEDLKDLQELGAGNGGSVKKVEHIPTGTIMAKKVCMVP